MSMNAKSIVKASMCQACVIMYGGNDFRSPRSMTKSKSRSPSPATNKKYDDDDDKSDREDD